MTADVIDIGKGRKALLRFTRRNPTGDMPDFPPIPPPRTDPETAILMWEKRVLAIDHFWNNMDHDPSDEFTDRLCALEQPCWYAIAGAPADTFPALAVKIRMLTTEASWGSGPDYCWNCINTLADDIERMAGAP